MGGIALGCRREKFGGEALAFGYPFGLYGYGLNRYLDAFEPSLECGVGAGTARRKILARRRPVQPHPEQDDRRRECTEGRDNCYECCSCIHFTFPVKAMLPPAGGCHYQPSSPSFPRKRESSVLSYMTPDGPQPVASAYERLDWWSAHRSNNARRQVLGEDPLVAAHLAPFEIEFRNIAALETESLEKFRVVAHRE